MREFSDDALSPFSCQDVNFNITNPVIFSLRESDKPAFTRHTLRLSWDSRQLRFGYPITDDALIRFCNEFPLDENSFGLLHDGALEGAAIVVQDFKEPSCFELALTLAPSFRNKGWGTKLVEAALQQAHRNGKKHMCVDYGYGNLAMEKLCRKFPGGAIRDGGTYHKVIDVQGWNRVSRDRNSAS